MVAAHPESIALSLNQERENANTKDRLPIFTVSRRTGGWPSPARCLTSLRNGARLRARRTIVHKPIGNIAGDARVPFIVRKEPWRSGRSIGKGSALRRKSQ